MKKSVSVGSLDHAESNSEDDRESVKSEKSSKSRSTTTSKASKTRGRPKKNKVEEDAKSVADPSSPDEKWKLSIIPEENGKYFF